MAPNDEGAFGGRPYDDREVAVEFYWAAVELGLPTGEPTYQQDFEQSPLHLSDVFDLEGFDGDHVGSARRAGSDRSRRRGRRSGAAAVGQP